jgi:hypothetical protein
MDRGSRQGVAGWALVLAFGLGGLGLGCGSSGASTTGGGTGTTGGSTGGTTTGGATSGGSTSTTSGGNPDAGPTYCDPLAPTNICTPLGLFCAPLPGLVDGGIVSACRLPREQETCLPSVGCDDPGTVCDTFQPVYTSGGGPVVTFCARICDPSRGSTDCPYAKTTCRSDQSGSHGVLDVCRTTRCGPTVAPANGTGFFGACDASMVGDGYCIPYVAVVGDEGICLQAGPAAPIGSCSFSRTGGTTDSLCPAGSFCNPSALDGGAARCLPVCAIHAISGSATTPACSSSELCLGFAQQGLDFGACAVNCTQDASVCPTGTQCKPTSDPNLSYCAN